MSASVAFNVRTTGAKRVFDALIEAQVDTGPLLTVVGRGMRNLLKSHFVRKDRTPNALGGGRTHFWREVSDSVQNPVPSGQRSVVITISDPRFAQKLYGGTISPKRGRALTIPVSAEAHGKTVKEFESGGSASARLTFIKRTGKTPLLVRVLGDRIEVHYVLVRSVTQAADPTALPSQDEFDSAAKLTSEEYLRTIISQ